jgi:hypothetical protein
MLAFLDGVNLYFVLAPPTVLAFVVAFVGWRRERIVVLMWCILVVTYGVVEIAIHERVGDRYGESLPINRWGFVLLSAGLLAILIRFFPAKGPGDHIVAPSSMRRIWIAQPVVGVMALIAWGIGGQLAMWASTVLTVALYLLVGVEIASRRQMRRGMSVPR